MSGIPAVDPIPLPAPVWLFKSLYLLTFGLHFIAVEMLVGGLLVATILNLLSSPQAENQRRAASTAIARGPDVQVRLKPAMLIHHKAGTWTALTAVCTHLGCTAEYVPDRDIIHCNCHGGEYDSFILCPQIAATRSPINFRP